MYSTKRTYRCPYSPATEKQKIFSAFSSGKFPSELVGEFKVTLRTLFQYHYLWGKSRELRDEVMAVIESRSQAGRTRMRYGVEREIWDGLSANLLNFVERFPLTFFRPKKTTESLVPELTARWKVTYNFTREVVLSSADPQAGRRLIDAFQRCITGTE